MQNEKDALLQQHAAELASKQKAHEQQVRERKEKRPANESKLTVRECPSGGMDIARYAQMSKETYYGRKRDLLT